MLGVGQIVWNVSSGWNLKFDKVCILFLVIIVYLQIEYFSFEIFFPSWYIYVWHLFFKIAMLVCVYKWITP